MKAKIAIIIVAVAVVFGVAVFFVGKSVESGGILGNDSAENNAAYQKGWEYWFSGYGYDGAGMKYIDYYTEGRNYNAPFENTREAFYAGYRDGFYFVNHKEDTRSEELIEKGYLAYYPG